MRVLIATGIYPPEVGGPAYYAVGLAEALKRTGNDVRVVTYGSLKKLPMGVRHCAYFLKLLPHVFSSDVLIALDTFSVALPASVACRLFRVPLVVRTGGDFLWEQYIDRTGDSIPLVDFYTTTRDFTTKERWIYSLTKHALADAEVVFSTDLQRTIWLSAYGISPARTSIIQNALEGSLPSEEPASQNFLWYVRPTGFKNAARVHAAFAKAKQKFPTIILEEGTLPKDILLERMKDCYAVILPSLTEISPNYILDALRFHKPFIMDKYSGYAQWLSPYGALVDPLDENDIARAIEQLADPDFYADACKRAAAFSQMRSYDEVAKDFLALIAPLL